MYCCSLWPDYRKERYRKFTVAFNNVNSRMLGLHYGDLVYSLCSLLTYSFYLISFDQIIVLQMLQLYVK